MAEKMPLDIWVKAVAVGGTYDYVESEIVPPGELWCLQHYAFENETGARGVLRCYKGDQAFPYFLKEEQSPATDELVWDDAPIFLRPGQRLGFRQTSCTTADVLKLYATGYKMFGKFIE